MKLRLRAPATSANLGPGFDVLGVALNLYNRFAFDTDCDGLQISGCDPAYATEENLAVQAWRAVEARLGARPCSLRLDIAAGVPVARGLGSSATLLAAGAAAANCAYGEPFSREELLEIIAAIEGHPDNVAPALLGGLRASRMADGQVLSVDCPVAPSLGFCALVPNFETRTEDARRVVPRQVALPDAVYNLSCLALTLRALETGDMALLSAALDDRLHQPWRRDLIHEYARVEAAAQARGAALCISGSGSTLLALLPAAETAAFATAVGTGLADSAYGWRAYPLQVDRQGVVFE